MEKVKTGIYVSADVLAECYGYCAKNSTSRSKLIEQAMKLFLATREIANKRDGKPLSRKTAVHHLSFISDVFSYAI